MNKESYQQFCQLEKDIPIFSQPWYLDATCGSNEWDILLVRKGNEIAVTMPILKQKKYGFLLRRMPPITPYLGPYFPKKFRSPKSQQKLTRELIRQFPRFDFFEQNLSPSFNNGLPFFWENFKSSIRYTFTIDLSKDLDEILQRVSPDYRNNKIPKAQKIVSIVSNDNIEDFYLLQKKTFGRQNLKTPISLEFLKDYDKILNQQKSRQLFFAIDDGGKIHSAIYLIWDQHTVYLQMAADDPHLRNNGASIYLIWHAIEYSKSVLQKNKFDFVGSMIEPISRVRRNFGAQQIPYFNIKKIESILLRIIYDLK